MTRNTDKGLKLIFTQGPVDLKWACYILRIFYPTSFRRLINFVSRIFCVTVKIINVRTTRAVSLSWWCLSWRWGRSCSSSSTCSPATRHASSPNRTSQYSPRSAYLKGTVSRDGFGLFDPPCLLAHACYFRQYFGFGEGEALQKICNSLPICETSHINLAVASGNGNKEFYREATSSNFK